MTRDVQNLIICDILSATMPDGSPISIGVKVDTIIAHSGLAECPDELRRLLTMGVQAGVNSLRRSRSAAPGSRHDA